MLHRLIYEDWQLIFPLVAFAVASSIGLATAIRAVRMNRAPADRSTPPAGLRRD